MPRPWDGCYKNRRRKKRCDVPFHLQGYRWDRCDAERPSNWAPGADIHAFHLWRLANGCENGDVLWKKRQPTTGRWFKDIRLVIPIDGSFSVFQKFLVFLFLWLSMACIAIATDIRKLVTYVNSMHRAYVSFFRPLPLGFGWASMIAAYSGSRALWWTD